MSTTATGSPPPSLDRTRVPALQPPRPMHLPRPQPHRLTNGLDVYIVERPTLPTVDVRLVVRTGADHDDPARAGRASMVAELVDEGADGRSALAIADEIETLGAELVIRATWDESYLALHVLTPMLAAGLEVLASVAARPDFDPQEIERGRREHITALIQERDEPRTLVNNLFAAALFGAQHPYGAPLRGTVESIETMPAGTLRAFQEAYYRPNHAFAVVAGDVQEDALLPLVERSLGAWVPRAVPAVEPLPQPPPGPRVIHLLDRPMAPQSELRLGWAGPPRSTDDYYPLLVLNTLLGGAFTSRLNQRLRQEKGYTYGAASGFAFRRQGGPFLVGTAVFTEATADTVETVLHELARLREELIPAPELERTVRYLTLGLARRFETTAAVTERVAEAVLFGLGDDYYDHFVDRVRCVTAADLREVAGRYLFPERAVIAVVGDQRRIEGQLRALSMGDVTTHQIP